MTTASTEGATVNNLTAYNLTTGEPVLIGSEVEVYNHGPAMLEGLERANSMGQDGKVVVRYLDGPGGAITDERGYFYARVVGLEVRDEDRVASAEAERRRVRISR